MEVLARDRPAAGPPGRVVLVGFEDQDNLGLRYLSSRLRQAGHRTRLVAVTDGPGPVLDAIRTVAPHVVGFSLIFQYLVPQFGRLLARLRADGVTAHFTMGGHYASFEPEALLHAIPELDSVVRFEGEDTLLELTERIAAGRRWDDVAGVAARGPAGVILAPGRPGRMDLDTLPWPDRDDIRYDLQRLPTASILGGRGCPWRCSFCSIITFYEANGTKGRRRRDPARVVDELEYLHCRRGARIILWQDDDFLAGGRAGVKWAHAIARECVRRGLHRDMRWKISCRSDEVSVDALAPLVEAGLTHVYMGVESGDADDLERLNKRLKPDVHLRAGDVLRRLDVSFDFGFMLLQPWSTAATVRNNLAFLRAFVGDGASTVTFCRTLPYVGTALEERLRAEGRLRTLDPEADYRFLDPRLDAFYDWLLGTFADRNFSPSGTVNLLRLLLFEAHLDLPDRRRDPVFLERARSLTAVANQVVLDTLASALDHVESLAGVGGGDPVLAVLAAHHAAEDARLHEDLAALTARRTDIRERLHLTR
jgi:anaerobic magnesium-protoporphyrin IX monomethyl ester cyclase